MNKTLKTMASGAAALSITAGSAFAQNNTQNIDRKDLDGGLNSATICSIDDGFYQKFIDVRSIRQCFDNGVKATKTQPPVSITAYRRHLKVREFSCTRDVFNGELTCESFDVQSP